MGIFALFQFLIALINLQPRNHETCSMHTTSILEQV